MCYRLKCVVITLAVLIPMPVAATDLSKIDRTIGKEPTYESKPKYCLLVFGPEAKTRVWLVLDGDVLYVDRNGNGDLTEPNEKVAWRDRTCVAGDITCLPGKAGCTGIQLAKYSGGSSDGPITISLVYDDKPYIV